MCKSLLKREYAGFLTDIYHWRDNPYYFTSLDVTQTLSLHEGCVNTICWGENGELLLSGSDDRCICVTPVFSCPDRSMNIKPSFTQRLPADSNIFSAKFLPGTCNSQVVAGFKCGCVLSVRIDGTPGANVEPVFCHNYAVYDVLTFPDMPTCFLTLSHDQSVICFDTRLPFRFDTSRYTCNQRCSFTYDRPSKFIGCSNRGVASMRFGFPVTAGDVHPLSGSHCVALACADGFVRLFDLRRFVRSGVTTPSGTVSQPEPFQLVRPLGLPAKLSESRTIRLDYGPAHITSVQFEPLYSHSYSPFCSSGRRTDIGVRHLLVSHMYAPVFLFDLKKTETAKDPEPQAVSWLPEGDTNRAGLNGESGPRQVRPSLAADPTIRIALAFFCWIERQRRRRQSTENSSTTEAVSTPPDESQETSGDDLEQDQSINQNQQSEESGDCSFPLEKLTDDYVKKMLQSAPRLRQLMEYQGRRSCRTVIKTACFWGRDHILSGSECGHVIGWNRHSGQPVKSIVADAAVVNRIEPHPTLPLFACSGLDHSIKIVEPVPAVFQGSEDLENHFDILRKKHADDAAELCAENAASMLQSLQAGSLCFDRLARLRNTQAFRAAFRRFAANRSTDG